MHRHVMELIQVYNRITQHNRNGRVGMLSHKTQHL